MNDTLPPLPDPAAWHCYWRGDNDSTSWDQWHDASDPLPDKWDDDAPDEVTPHYTADQLRAYGTQCAAAERERWREPLRAIAETCEWNAQAPGDDAERWARVAAAARGFMPAAHPTPAEPAPHGIDCHKCNGNGLTHHERCPKYSAEDSAKALAEWRAEQARLAEPAAPNARRAEADHMTDEQITAALAEVGAAWLMDEADEHCQANAMRHLVAAAVAAERERWQPIETAPRGSGTDGPDDTRHPDYVEPPRLLLWTLEGPVVGYYDWYYHPGYGHGAEEGVSAWRDHNGCQAYGASYWMPLPAPPHPGQTP